MPRGKRILFASLILLAGACGAWLFRTPEAAPKPAKAADKSPQPAPFVVRKFASLGETQSALQEAVAADAAKGAPATSSVPAPTASPDSPPSTQQAVQGELASPYDANDGGPPMAAEAAPQPSLLIDWDQSQVASPPKRVFREASPPAADIERLPPAYPQSAEGQPARTHVVRDGDTLFKLAERYYGDGNRYLAIYEANRERLPSAEILPIGAKLTIPPYQPQQLTLQPREYPRTAPAHSEQTAEDAQPQRDAVDPLAEDEADSGETLPPVDLVPVPPGVLEGFKAP